MKIRIAMIDSDKSYATRFFKCINDNYSDKIEIHVFSDIESFYELRDSIKFEVLLLQENLQLKQEIITNDIIVIYLVEKLDLQCDIKCVYKYQKLSLIYKEILNYYSEKYAISNSNQIDNNQTKVISFMSNSSGSGSSTISSSFSIRLSKKGKKFYIWIYNNSLLLIAILREKVNLG